MKNITKYILYVLIAVIVVVMGLFYFGGGENIAFDTTNPDADLFYVPNYTTLAISLAKILLFAAAILAVVIAVYQLFLAPKKSAKSLLGIALIGGVLLISYLVSDTTPIKLAGQESLFTDAFRLRLADVCLYSSWILLVVVIVAIVLSNIMKLVR